MILFQESYLSTSKPSRNMVWFLHFFEFFVTSTLIISWNLKCRGEFFHMAWAKSFGDNPRFAAYKTNIAKESYLQEASSPPPWKAAGYRPNTRRGRKVGETSKDS